MSTHLPGFLVIFSFFASFCIGQITHQEHGEEALSPHDLIGLVNEEEQEAAASGG